MNSLLGKIVTKQVEQVQDVLLAMLFTEWLNKLIPPFYLVRSDAHLEMGICDKSEYVRYALLPFSIWPSSCVVN